MATSNSSDSFDSKEEYYQDKTKYKIKKPSNFYFYNIFLFIMISLPIAVTGFINWLIDPQDVFNTPNYLGVNNIKPHKDDNDRLFKAIDITRIRPKTIIVGSSRTKQAINPEYPVFDQSSGVYNLALNGPNFYEVRRYVEHAIYNQPDLQEIILGIDFFMFNSNLDNQPTFSESRLEKKHITLDDGIKVLFSLDTLSNSKDTITASKQDSATDDSYGENGFMPNRNADKPENIWRFNQSIKLYFTLHSDYEFSEQYWSDFEKLVKLCEQNNIKLKVFISPSHATQWESIYVTNRWQVFEEWKRKIAQLTPVWDFSGYNSVTTEKINASMNNYVDNSHYVPAIGNLILNRIFDYQTSEVPDDFGVLLTPDNMEEHLDNIRQERQKWLKNNPEEVDLVKKLFTETQNVN
ncbi:MAG: hypothetical protein QNJ32_17720 [Xenococcaceae cyanobacterium MO_167.B27]|nr:hypothetical protein [Xenococcaceae cyanobacterium MO_167.B27]